MDTNGFYGDTFSSGFGDFYTAKKRDPSDERLRYNGETPYSQADKFYSAQPGLSAWGERKLKVGRVTFTLRGNRFWWLKRLGRNIFAFRLFY